MKASELIKQLQEKINKYGDLEIMICQSDIYGGEVNSTNVSVTTYTSNKDEENFIVVEEERW